MARPAAATVNLALGAAVAAAALAAGAMLAASDPFPFTRMAAVVAGAVVGGLGLLQATATLLLLRGRRAGFVVQLLAGALLAVLLLLVWARTQAWPVALLLLLPAALLALPFLPSVKPEWRTGPAPR